MSRKTRIGNHFNHSRSNKKGLFSKNFKIERKMNCICCNKESYFKYDFTLGHSVCQNCGNTYKKQINLF